MNCTLRGLRVIDALAGLDQAGQDVRFEAGRITAIGPGLEAGPGPSVDLAGCILSPGFLDLHVHLREPGGEPAETVATGAAAAAAGGFTRIVAMANTVPPIDTPDRVAAAVLRNRAAPVRVLQVAALTRGLEGRELVDIDGCVAAGAAAFSDDGRNAAGTDLLAEGLRLAGAAARPVLVHPEDEDLIRALGQGAGPVARLPGRPPEAELRAVEAALTALRRAPEGRLHLQHLSVAGSVALLRTARDQGLPVTAEVTPHHLAMPLSLDPAAEPPALAKVNPPLRGAADCAALAAALRERLIDAIATDHAPHPEAEKGADHAAAAPGMVGLETALATCLSAGGDDAGWPALVIDRLTAGPHGVLAATGMAPAPRLVLGEPATCTVIDTAAMWVLDRRSMRSRSGNTPLLGRRLRGRAILTLVDGAVTHRDAARLGAAPVTARG